MARRRVAREKALPRAAFSTSLMGSGPLARRVRRKVSAAWISVMRRWALEMGLALVLVLGLGGGGGGMVGVDQLVGGVGEKLVGAVGLAGAGGLMAKWSGVW